MSWPATMVQIIQEQAQRQAAAQQAYANYRMQLADGQQRMSALAAQTPWSLQRQIDAAYQMQNMYLMSDPKHEAERRQAEHEALERRRAEIFGEDLSDVMAETDRLATKWL